MFCMYWNFSLFWLLLFRFRLSLKFCKYPVKSFVHKWYLNRKYFYVSPININYVKFHYKYMSAKIKIKINFCIDKCNLCKSGIILMINLFQYRSNWTYHALPCIYCCSLLCNNSVGQREDFLGYLYLFVMKILKRRP